MIKKLKKLPKLLFVILAFVFLLNFYLATRDSQTIDEGAHLASGYSYVTTGDFRLNPEHPALFKLLAGTAILPLDTKSAKELKGWDEANQWPAGKDLIYNSRSSARQILLLARLPSIFITVALIYAVFLLARRLASEKVGLLAAGLFSLDPTLNGHGHLVTNDIFLGLGAVVFLLGALNYWTKPNKKHLLLFALATLLIISAKFSGLLLVPIAVVVVLIKQWPHKKRLLKHLLAALAIVFFGICLQYGLRIQTFRQELASTEQNDPLVLRAMDYKQKHPGLAWVYNLPVPAYPYIRGIANLIHHNKEGHPTYLSGQRSRSGNLLYFPVAMATKLPEIIIAANLVAVSFIIFKYRRSKNLLILLLFAGVFVGTSIVSNINIGVRHVFGAWPFIYIAAAMILSKVLKGRRTSIYAMLLTLLLVPVLIGAIRTPIAYQNALGGALENLSNKPLLVDSNRDWAQDLYRLNDYLEAKGIDHFGEGLFNNTQMSDIFSDRTICTIEYYTAGCTDYSELPCTLAISDTALWLDASEFYKWTVDNYDLVDRVGGSVGIYHCRD